MFMKNGQYSWLNIRLELALIFRGNIIYSSIMLLVYPSIEHQSYDYQVHLDSGPTRDAVLMYTIQGRSFYRSVKIWSH